MNNKINQVQSRFADTEAETEKINETCWMHLQCHSHESIRGWAFRVFGLSLTDCPDWQYGYPSKDEARHAAIDLIEELVKSRIRALSRDWERLHTTLGDVQQMQQQRGDRNV